MANNKEEAGKGTPRPGEMPGSRRTYATIDLTAAEVEGRAGPAPTGAATSPSAAQVQASSQGKSDPKPAPDKGAGSADRHEGRADGAPTSLAARFLAIPWLPHLASGALGALVVLIATELATTPPTPPRALENGDLIRRVSELEAALKAAPQAAPQAVAPPLAETAMPARIEELGRSMAALGETQAKLARDTKTLESRLASPIELPGDLMHRLSKLEEALGAAVAADPMAQSAHVAALSGKLAELDKLARGSAEQAKASNARSEGELSQLKADAGRLSQRLDTLKGEIEERLKGTAKTADLGTLTSSVAALQGEVEAFRKGQAERAASADANATQMLLALELANLKRAVDRGEGYADELARAKKLAGFSANFAALERHSDGAPPLQALAKSFRKAADAMLDAEAEPGDATLMDRLLSGARSIVRVRRATHGADDTSLEALISRMEVAVKEGRLAEVLANAKKLPPKAALAGEDWIRGVEARQAVDEAMAEVETRLKAALGANRTSLPEAKR
jgi:hypothetical protein